MEPERLAQAAGHRHPLHSDEDIGFNEEEQSHGGFRRVLIRRAPVAASCGGEHDHLGPQGLGRSAASVMISLGTLPTTANAPTNPKLR